MTTAMLGLGLAVALVAAWTDTRTGHIPNWLTLPVLGAAPIAHLVMQGATGLFASLLGVIGCALLPLFLYSRGAFGGGDVKLFAALGALLGLYRGLEVQLAAFLAGALLAFAGLAFRGGLGTMLKRTLYLAVNPFLPRARRRVIPQESFESFRFGGAILIGVAVVGARYVWGK